MHAVVMAEFARACLKKMNMLVQVLAGHLGSDTASLDFRVGLHSGKVTAGVLRGGKCPRLLCGCESVWPSLVRSLLIGINAERSRFQLFGDVSP